MEDVKVSSYKEAASLMSPHQPSSLDDTLTLPWSSGTTGLPKAIEITHRNIISMVCSLRAVPGTYRDGEKSLSVC